jgi:hypothetical protein
VGDRTLWRWLTEDSEFKAEYEAARSAMFQVGMSRIQALAGRQMECPIGTVISLRSTLR